MVRLLLHPESSPFAESQSKVEAKCYNSYLYFEFISEETTEGASNLGQTFNFVQYTVLKITFIAKDEIDG